MQDKEPRKVVVAGGTSGLARIIGAMHLLSPAEHAMAIEDIEPPRVKTGRRESRLGYKLGQNLTPKQRGSAPPARVNPLTTLPIRTAQDGRPAGMSARQWKKLRDKGHKREQAQNAAADQAWADLALTSAPKE